MRIAVRTKALASMKAIADHCQGSSTMPSATPAAGGCSVFVAIIIMIPRPTARPAAKLVVRLELSATVSSIGAFIATNNREPDRIATSCPPITFLGVEAMLSGNTNMVKAVEAMETIIASLKRKLWTMRMAAINTIASEHWNR